MGTQQSGSKREVYSNIIKIHETRKIPYKQPNLTLKETKDLYIENYKTLVKEIRGH